MQPLTALDMPTKYYSRLHTEDGNAAADSDAVTVLRTAGALIFGKTATTEFAAMTEGGPCTNPHNAKHTPGGSSSGSAAAVADFQVPISIGTQTGGSIVRPGSFNGIYGFKVSKHHSSLAHGTVLTCLKPTWASVSTEGVSRFSVSCDSVGFYARSVEDMHLLARLYELDPHATIPPPPLSLAGARVAFCKTHRWHYAGKGTQAVWETACMMLRDQGAAVTDLELPAEFARSQEWRETVVNEEARAAFLPSRYR